MQSLLLWALFRLISVVSRKIHKLVSKNKHQQFLLTIHNYVYCLSYLCCIFSRAWKNACGESVTKCNQVFGVSVFSVVYDCCFDWPSWILLFQVLCSSNENIRSRFSSSKRNGPPWKRITHYLDWKIWESTESMKQTVAFI